MQKPTEKPLKVYTSPSSIHNLIMLKSVVVSEHLDRGRKHFEFGGGGTVVVQRQSCCTTLRQLSSHKEGVRKVVMFHNNTCFVA